jgi:probable HAF family extracellular repeat protein
MSIVGAPVGAGGHASKEERKVPSGQSSAASFAASRARAGDTGLSAGSSRGSALIHRRALTARHRRQGLLRMATVSLITLAASGIVLTTPAMAASPLDLGTLGGNDSSASTINDRGEVVGSAQTSVGSYRAFLWTRREGMVDLGTLGGNESYAWKGGINDHGEVVGSAQTSTGAEHAFLWTRSEGMLDLGTLGGAWSQAHEVNDRGEVDGNSQTSTGATRAFFWTRKGGMVDLGTLGGNTSGARAMNESGQVVGSAETDIVECPGGLCRNTEHAFSWTRAGGMVDLGTLAAGLGNSEATAVNDHGQVAGDGQSGRNCGDPCETDAFLWTARGGLVDLHVQEPEPSYPPTSFPSAINDRGQIVGSGHQHVCFFAFSWTQAEGVVGLPDLPGYECLPESVSAVNDSGQVVGSDGGEGQHAVYWTPSGGAVDLGPGDAADVNDFGQIVGATSIPNGPEELHHAALWETGRHRKGS